MNALQRQWRFPSCYSVRAGTAGSNVGLTVLRVTLVSREYNFLKVYKTSLTIPSPSQSHSV